MKLAQDLRELHALLNDGILTEEEFEAQKAKLLADQEPGIRVEPEEMQAEDGSEEEVTESTEPPETSAVEAPDAAPAQEAIPAPGSIEQSSIPAPSAPPRKKRFLKLALAGLLVAGLGIGTWLLVGGSSQNASALIEELPANSRVALAIDASVVTGNSNFTDDIEELVPICEEVVGFIDIFRENVWGITQSTTSQCQLLGVLKEIESISCSVGDGRTIACVFGGNLNDSVASMISTHNKGGELRETTLDGHRAWLEFDDSADESAADAFGIIDLKETGIAIGHTGGIRNLLAARTGKQKNLSDNEVLRQALGHVDKEGIILIAGEETSDKAGGGLIRGALSYALSVSVTDTLTIRAVALPSDKVMLNQLRRASPMLDHAKKSGAEVLAELRSLEKKFVESFRGMSSDFGSSTQVDTFLAAGKKGFGILDIESSAEILTTLLANAKIEETDGRFTFEASSPISEESLNKLALAIPLMAVRYFSMLGDIRNHPAVHRARPERATGAASGMGRVQAVSK